MNHPLDGAYIRLDRAKKHLAELEATNRTYLQYYIEAIQPSITVESYIEPRGNLAAKIRHELPEQGIPPLFSVIVGDTVNNLRVALDYLVYELARLNTGSPQKGTQFPIESTPDGFRTRSQPRPKGKTPSMLQFVDAAHIAEIEKLQPYNGVQWTEWLTRVSNPDKHRHLTICDTKVLVSVRAMGHGDVKTEPQIGQLVCNGEIIATDKITGLDDPPMYMEASVTYFVALDGRLHVINMLHEIATQVGDTLANFKPEFK